MPRWGLAALVPVFLVVRIALLLLREPFFDELFTVWMARRPWSGIVPALLLDSGPPLYYFLARLTDVFALRVLSLVFACAAFGLVLTRRSLGDARFPAALLLTLYPPAALFAVDARSYALCALLVAIGTIAIHEERPLAGAAALLLAAYTHWYGALFLPVLLFAKPRRRAWAALAGAAVLFLPGLWLASRQPAQATGWIEGSQPFAAANALAFAGRYAEALFAPAPLVVAAISAVALVVAVVRKWTSAPMVLVPLGLAVAFAVSGRTVYFPMRFEAVLAVPLVLWIATSLAQWPRTVRLVLLAVLCGSGAAAIAIGTLDHANRPLDAYRQAVRFLDGRERVVATGYLYLEAAHRLGNGKVEAFPARQATHPGWRAPATAEPLPEGTYLWAVERGVPELALLRQRPQVVFANDRALVLRVANFHP